MFSKLAMIFRIPELRQKIVLTFILLAVYRLGFSIPLPFIDQEQLNATLENVGGAEGGGAEAAVAVDDGGKALTQLRRAEARAEQRRVGVAMDVNEAGGNGPAGGVDNMSGGRGGQIADGGDPAAGLPLGARGWH